MNIFFRGEGGSFGGQEICLKESIKKKETTIFLFLGYHWIERKRRITSLLSKLQIRYINNSPPLVVREVLGPVHWLNRVITKDVKSCTFCRYVWYATFMYEKGGGVIGPKTGATYCYGCTVRTSRQRSSCH